MRIAFIARSTLYEIHGGSAVQILETAKHLNTLGATIQIFLAHEKINYKEFDLLHFFDLTRPANILYHLHRSGKPFVISPILVDYSEYDRTHRHGITGAFLRAIPSQQTEYLKTVGRWILGKDSLRSKAYLWKGQKKSIREILENASMILPNSLSECNRLHEIYGIQKPYAVIPNGVDTELFSPHDSDTKEEDLVVCAARLEGLKNQLNLIKALSNTKFNLLLIGETAPNQKKYGDMCRKVAGPNIQFAGRLPQKDLAEHYRKAKVHILPSWFETCGLSSIEAAAMGCNIVITDKGFTRDHFGDDAFYCDPGNIDSIYNAVLQASQAPQQKKLQQKVLTEYTWQQAALKTFEAYKKIL